ncbi:hypothetical protein E2562_037416, partial [Oryza meyeriana var. granulata]
FDSGVYIMKIIQMSDRKTHPYFRPEHAKPLRECLTYYMISHRFNEKHNPEVIAIMKKYTEKASVRGLEK